MNKKDSIAKKWLSNSNFYVLVATILIIIAFASASENFLSAYNIYNISRTAGIYIFIGLGQACVILLGGSNLALGQMGGLSAIIAGYCMQELGWGLVPGVLIGLITGIVLGYVNGFIQIKFRLSMFMVTLATQFIFDGFILAVSKGFPFTKLPEGFTVMGTGSFLGIPYVFLLAVGVLLLLWYFFRYTVLGRKILATGGNKEAAKMAGIKTDNILMLSNVACGFFAALTGLLWTSRMGAAQPSTGGDWMLISFAVAVIGGTSNLGGVIAPLSLIVSGILMVMIKNGLVLLQANVYLEQTYLGLIILIAMSLDSLRPIISEYQLKRQLKKEAQMEKE